MKRLPRFAVALLAASALVPFLPCYLERTMVRSMRSDHVGDVIGWGWKLCMLRGFWSDYSYLRPEQQPAVWLAVNLTLGLIYAFALAIGIDQFSVRRERAAGRTQAKFPAGSG